jgi:hypothetical protein
MGFDPNVGKGRPAVVQTGDRATVFYAGTGTGVNTLYYAHFDGTSFAQPQPIALGLGFESFGTPSVSPRYYQGATDPNVPALVAGTPILDLTFTGKLRDRAHSEVYFARMFSDTRLIPVNVPGSRSPLVYLPRITQERLVAEGEPGTYHARGLMWQNNPANPNLIYLEQRLNGVTTPIELDVTKRAVDTQTGKIAFNTSLGGRVYVDPAVGTVRFSGTIPNRNATILLSYTPRILRVSSSGGAAYTGPSGLWDNHFEGDLSYWANRLNQRVDPVNGGSQARMDRYVFTYSRAAAGAGSAARPYMRTMRLGVQLPTAIHVKSDGTLTGFSVAGMTNTATSYYQVDPANGRVYFTAENENVPVTVTYVPVDESTGNALPAVQFTANVTMIPERAEAPIAIEQAVNESQLFSFIDPIEWTDPSHPPRDRRPGLIWMVYTSTRAGGPDIYIQTIAPRFTPQPTTRGGG